MYLLCKVTTECVILLRIAITLLDMARQVHSSVVGSSLLWLSLSSETALVTERALAENKSEHDLQTVPA